MGFDGLKCAGKCLPSVSGRCIEMHLSELITHSSTLNCVMLQRKAFKRRASFELQSTVNVTFHKSLCQEKAMNSSGVCKAGHVYGPCIQNEIGALNHVGGHI